MGINKQQALDCLASDDLIGIGMEADACRRKLHEDGVVTYAVNHSVGLDQTPEDIVAAVSDLVAEGATTVCLTSVPGMLATFEAALSAIRRRFPALRLHGAAAPNIISLAQEAGVSEFEALQRLARAGLESISGEVDDTEFDRWLAVHRQAHRARLRSSAVLPFGRGESLAERVEQLFALRQLQDETGGLTSFTSSGFRPAAGRGAFEEPTAVEYLRMLGTARLVLDNIPNIESSCAAQGLKVMQMALRFGANDGGALDAASSYSFSEEELRRIIREAGFKPVERDAAYQTVFLGN